MRAGQPGISGDIVGPVLRALADAGAPQDARADPIVAGADADAMIDAAAERLGDDAIALTLARRIPIGGLGVVDYALSTSGVLRDALHRVARYYGVVTQRVTLTLKEGPSRATLLFERRPRERYSRHWAEFGPAMIAERIRQTLGGEVVFEEVAFAHEAPASVARHEEFFGREVLFGQAQDRLGLAPGLLDARLRTGAAALAELLEQKMRDLEPVLGAPDPFLAKVHLVVGQLLDARETSLQAAAERLRLTRRTMQRELQTRGTSHKEILDEVRRERALRLLEDGTLTLAEVAYRLGLSEPSAFFRAFRRWTGTSPNAFRARR